MGQLDFNKSTRTRENDWNESLTAQDGHLHATRSIRESLQIKYQYHLLNGKEVRFTQASCCFWTFAELEVYSKQSSGPWLLAAPSQEGRPASAQFPHMWSQDRCWAVTCLGWWSRSRQSGGCGEGSAICDNTWVVCAERSPQTEANVWSISLRIWVHP